MKIEIKKFGTHLISRPEGRDAALVIKNQFLNDYKGDSIEIDFTDVKLMTPSWLDEIYQELLTKFAKDKISFTNTSNSSVNASIETVCDGN
jgi:hypothetical protein